MIEIVKSRARAGAAAVKWPAATALAFPFGFVVSVSAGGYG